MQVSVLGLQNGFLHFLIFLCFFFVLRYEREERERGEGCKENDVGNTYCIIFG